MKAAPILLTMAFLLLGSESALAQTGGTSQGASSVGTSSLGAGGGAGTSVGSVLGTGTQGGQMFGAVQQGGMVGAVQGTTTTTTGTTTSNPFSAYYRNPLAAGIVGGSPTVGGSRTAGATSGGFGTPLYPSTGLTTTGTTGVGTGSLQGLLGSTLLGNLGSANIFRPTGSAGNFGNQATGLTTSTMQRLPAVVVVPDFDARPVNAGILEEELQRVIERSTTLTSKENIRVTVGSEMVVMKGQVSDERQRRLAEAMIRLTPGVRNVRNDLEVVKPLPLPRQEP